MKNKKLIIFDLQGTLVKSMRPPVLNGCKADLFNLIKLGYTLAIFTGGSNTEVLNILTKLDILDLFKKENIITKQSGLPSKPNPLAVNYICNLNDSKKVIYCGDTKKDMLVAKYSGVAFISFGKQRSGYFCMESLSELSLFISSKVKS